MLEEVICFGDQLHVGVFDAVVHHFDVVTCTIGADVCTARNTIHLG